jgi:hypothetical protein
MSMVFCRGCGKEIHETAPVCPHCGAPQNLPSSSNASRNTLVLIIVTLGWTFVMWIGSLVIVGMVVGVINPAGSFEGGYNAGYHYGHMLSLPILLISGGIATLLAIRGKLPGTSKK